MKKLAIVMLTSILAISLTAGLSVAQTDKLIVEDSAGNPVFKVNDTGTVNAVDFAVGTTLPPTNQFSLVDESGTNSRGMGAIQATTDRRAAVIDFRKMRGVYTASPTAANATLDGDFVGAFHGWGVDASGTWRRAATLSYYIDGPPTAGGVPIAMAFFTGTNDDGLANPKLERMTVGSDGKVTIKDLVGTGNAYVCVDSAGTIFRSNSPCL